MEFIFGLIVFWIGLSILGGILKFLGSLFNKGVSVVAPDSEYAQTHTPDSFTVKAEFKKKTYSDGEALDVISVSVKGLTKLPRDNINCCFMVLMTDVTDPENHTIVLSSIEELQEEQSVLFLYKSPDEVMPYENTVFSKYFELISIPTDFLRFAKKGNRKIKVMLLLANADNYPEVEYGAIVNNKDYIYAIATELVMINSKEPGFEDLKQHSKKTEELTIRLAMHVSSIDGDFHESEGQAIRDWVEKKIYSGGFSEDEVKEEKSRFNSYIKTAYADADNGDISVNDCTNELIEISSIAEHYEILELCMHVASADGIADGKELYIVKKIAQKLDLDMGRIREMQDKILPVSIHAEKTNEESIVGITPDMTSEQIRKHLNSEYRKWNAQVTNSDEKIRKQADDMIKIISKLRTKLVG